MSVLLKGGTLVSGGRSEKADLRMGGGVILETGRDLPEQDSSEEDVSGCLLFPGFIDAHTHFDMDTGTAHTADDFPSGTAAAVAGGTTAVLDFATQEKGETLSEALRNWHRKADGKAFCDYGFHMAITDWNPAVSREMDDMKKAGVTSFKLYMAYDALRASDAEIYEVMQRVRALHGMLGVHCENGDLVNERTRELLAAGNTAPRYHPVSRPEPVEAEAVERCLTIAGLAGLPVNIVHLSTAAGLGAVRRFRRAGGGAFVETCPQYLLLNGDRYDQPDFLGAKYVCSPPLRPERCSRALWEAVENGEVDTISTDHCSFNFKGQKELGRGDFSKIPNGLPGVEHRPALLFTFGVQKGRITPERMAGLLSENAAKQFGLYPKKGALLPGSDADVVVWDPRARGCITAEHQNQNVDYTPYEGFELYGLPRAVYLRGEKAAENGRVLPAPRGRYVPRGPSDYGARAGETPADGQQQK